MGNDLTREFFAVRQELNAYLWPGGAPPASAENLLQTTCLRCLEAADHEAGVEAGGD